MTKFYNPLVKIACLFASAFISFNSLGNIYTVTNTASSGAGSLAQAITDANANLGRDTIQFSLPVNQPCIITLTSALPDITDALMIDGYSQPGAFPGTMSGRNIRINIDGAGIGSGNSILQIRTSNVEIAGLALYRSPEYAIHTPFFQNNCSNIYIWGNYIGTDSTGNVSSFGNGAGGIDLNNPNSGVPVNHIVIGTNGDGVNDANEGNLISSNKANSTNGDGILLWSAEDSRISGNYIGLNKSGNGGFGNARYGIIITVRSIRDTIGTNGDGISDALETNYIANNGNSGVLIGYSDAVSDGDVVAGNVIGLSTSGVAAGNANNGVEIINSSFNRIGTNADGVSDDLEANVISSNGKNGIAVTVGEFFGFNHDAVSNVIAGNAIGTDITGSVVRGNTNNGIYISSITPTSGTITPLFVTNTRIGSDNSGVNENVKRNIIANNSLDGVLLEHLDASSGISGTRISKDSIFGNTQLGIELRPFGGTPYSVTPNDQDDVDAGPNGMLNFPVITMAKTDGVNFSVAGYTRPGSIVEIYIADGGVHPSPQPGGYTKNFGSGATYLFRGIQGGTLGGIVDDSASQTGTYTGADEGNGGPSVNEQKFGFNILLTDLPTPVSTSTPITALAIDPSGNTSMFSASQLIVLPVHLISFAGRVNSGKSYLTWTTAQESNNGRFEIERSSNGSTYTNIGTVSAKGELYNEYNFTDNGPLSSINFYRLKQVDRDGKTSYSNVIVLRADLGGSANARVSPNPFVDNLNLSYRLTKNETVQVRLFDQMGRIIRNYSIKGSTGINTYNMSNLGSLPTGFYTLELKGEKLSFIQQLIK